MFEREARINLSFVAAFVAIALIATFFAPEIIRFWRVDKCLDHGGRYDYASERCEGERESNVP